MNNLDNNTGKKAYIWNTSGSMVAAASSFLLLMFVTRRLGDEVGGVFSLAYTTAQIVLTVGKFGIRSYQATDINYKISRDVYINSRIVLTLMMLALDGIYILFAGYGADKAIIFLVVCAIKACDAIEDVYHGELQRRGYLDKAGISLFIRNVITIIVFGIAVYTLGEIKNALYITAAVSLLITIAMNNFLIGKYADNISAMEHINQESGYLTLLYQCFPLFLGTFLSLYIYNVPKYVIEYGGNEKLITAYTVLFIPTFVINLLSDFIFKPLLTGITKMWEEQNYSGIIRLILRQCFYITTALVLILLPTWFFGVKLLGVVYSIELDSYSLELMILMFGGGASALVYLAFNVLTCFRKQINITVNYLTGAIFITLLTPFLFERYGIMGAAVSYAVTELILAEIMLVTIFYYLRSGIKGKKGIRI